MLIFTLRPCLQKSPPRPLKMLKITPQLAPRWPDKPHLRPSWRHVSSILAPSSPILLPFWAARACPKSAKICQDSLQVIFLPKVAPKTSQTPSRPRFSSFRGRVFNLSGSIFLDFCFQFLAFCMDFLRGLTEEVQLERKGPAVLASGVFDIYIYIYTYIYI